MLSEHNNHQPIAVFDSGVGGISVLKALHHLLPNENYIFFGDSQNAPYGEKTTDEVRRLTSARAQYFMEKGAKAIVLACNTATSASAKLLRATYLDIPIIGIEPALKPAVLHDYGNLGRQPRILVMATALTLREEKFLKIYQQYQDKAEIISLPAPHLVRYVESGLIGSAEMQQDLSQLLAPYVAQPVDSVVLGCTHFPFAKHDIKKILGEDMLFFDGAEGAARELKNQLNLRGMLSDSTTPGHITFENSDPSAEHLILSQQLFEAKI